MARPISYEREHVIAEAMKGFWRFGYSNYDIASLTRTAGISRHSLYRVFGDKAGLFGEAMNHYRKTVAAPWLSHLENGEHLADLIEFFRQMRGEGEVWRGCLIAQTACDTELNSPFISQFIDDYYLQLGRAFEGLVERCQARAEIRRDIEAKAVAAWLVLTCKALVPRINHEPLLLPAIEAIEVLLRPTRTTIS